MNFRLLSLFLIFTIFSHAKDFYWIGDSGDWNNADHWSFTSNGPSSGQIPQSTDNVIFDNNSFINHTPIITFDNNAVNSFELTTNKTVIFNGHTLTISNNFNLNTYAKFSGTLIFDSNSNGTNYINTGGYCQNAHLQVLKGNWELKNHFLTSQSKKILINCENFDAKGYSLYAQSISSSGTNLNLENSAVFTFDSLNLIHSNKIGNDPIFHTNGSSILVEGEFSSSQTKDQTVICVGMTLEVEVTSDYNGLDVSCNGACDGEITATVTGSPGPFSYSIDNGPFTGNNVFSGLCSDFYNIEVTDSSQLLAPGVYRTCSAFNEQILPTPQLFFQPTGGGLPIPPSCPGDCDGQAFTTSGGGTGSGTLVVTWLESGEITSNPVGLCAGLNNITITDDNNCLLERQLFISATPPITFNTTITPPTCNGDSDAQILVSDEAGGNGAPYTYNFTPVPGNGQGSNPATGYSASTVSVTVFDSDGCASNIENLNIVDPDILTTTAINPQTVSCFGVCDGQLTALPVGGVPPYSFEWFDNATGVSTGFTDSIPSTFCPGDYFVRVTDAGGCVVVSPSVNIGTPTQVTASAQAYQASCFGVCDGSVDVDPSGGTPGYFYSWTAVIGGAGIGATDSISGLCAGEYQIIVEDNNGCFSLPIVVEVLDADEIILPLNGTNPTCYDACDGVITAIASGGAGGFSYTWTPNPPSGQGTDEISNLCGGILYELTVTDANTCTETSNLELTSPTVYDITTSQSDLDCFGDTDGTITATAISGGDGGPYTYTWFPAALTGQGSPTVTNLTAGNYSVTIADGVNCDTTLTFQITAPDELTANATVISQSTCFGDCNGSAQVVVNGGTPTVNISWNSAGSPTTPVVNNLCQGNYIVTLTDDNGCVATDNVSISEPDQYNVNLTQTTLNCFGDCNASATVNVISGGVPTYTITWNDPLSQNGATATNLCAGDYEALLTDQNSCDSIFTFSITDPDELTLSVVVSDNACFGTCSGNATLTPSGGTGTLTYDWFIAATNTSLGINNQSSGPLCPGTYYATVTDDNGCITTTANFDITELPPINSSLVSKTDASCGICDAQAEITATGGAGGFTYNWNPAPTISGQGTTIGNGLCGGVYSIDIEDVDGCITNQAVVINSVALEVLNLDSTDVSCFGDCDGETSVTFNCLQPPCIIEWFDNNTGLSTGQIGNNANSLCAGEYLALLTNNLDCVTSDTIEVGTPPEIIASLPTIIDENCFNACDGSATVNASGGEGNLFFNWSPLPGTGQGTTTAGGLCAGNWDITVTDDSNCSTSIPFTINPANEIIIDNISATDISCFGEVDGSATILASGGIGLLSYEWFICGTNTSLGNNQNLQPIGPGDYYAIVTDESGCSITSNCVTVNDQIELTSIVNTSFSSCFGICDGIIDVVPSGGSGTYFYQWLDDTQNPILGQTNDTIDNICQGTYFVNITDGNGCTIQLGPFDMTPPNSAWDIDETFTGNTCNGSCAGTATVIVNAGNNPPYTYLWDDPLTQNTPTAVGLCAGIYNITISDAGTCDTTIQFTIDEPPAFNNSGTQTNIDCNGNCNGIASVNPSGGVGPYTVTWSNGQIGLNAVGLCAGNITATIEDNNGCSLDTTFTILEPATSIAINSLFSNDATCGLCNGSATVNVTGGTPGYTYDWQGNPTGEGTNSVTNLCAGLISVDITDDNGCSITEVIPIVDISAEVLTTTFTDASCFGLCDGTADVSFTCSDPVCTQEWFNATTGVSTGITASAINSLCAADYFVQVTNGSGCVSIDNFTIDSPSQIIHNETITEITCAGDSDATITLAPTGGSGTGYLFDWTPIPPNGNGTNIADPIGTGLWTVLITDSDACTETIDFNILDTIPIVITPALMDITCATACDGSISTTVSGGYGNYTYQWFMNGIIMIGETNPNINNLCPGNYNLEVTDQNGCVQMLPNDVTVSEPFAVNTPITSTDILCNGDCNGTATITPTGGVPPYTINWYDSNDNLIGQNGNNATNLCPDDYYAIVTDDNNCMFTSATETITEPAAITFSTSSNDATCNGICDGDATLTMADGTPPYTYTWLDVLNNPAAGNSPNATFLCEGNYTVEGIDDNGCTTTPQNIVIGGFEAITANTFSNDADCGIANGSASAFPNGGNPPYTFQWMDNALNPIVGETNSSILNIASGTYFVEVFDNNLCSETFQVDINDLPTTSLTWDLISHPSCFGANDGEIQTTVTGISLPLTLVWNPGGMITENISNLSAGNYTLQITDALGCVNFYDTTLVDPAEIEITSTVTDSDCDLCNGDITLILNGGTGILTSAWNNGETGTFIDNLCPAIYEVTVQDGEGCLITEQITVDNNSDLTASAAVSPISCPNNCDGEITITTTGGTTPYTVNWMNFASNNSTESNLCEDTYFIEVTDAIGCITPLQVDLLSPDPIVIVESVTPPDCGANDGSISITSTGGSLPHTYLWNNGATTPGITNLSAGVYTLTVTDFSGCSEDFVVTLNNSTAPTLTLSSTDLSCNGVCNGQITSNANGGTPGYQYQWIDNSGNAIIGETNSDILNQCAGVYTLEVEDLAGCLIFESIEIFEPDTILVNEPFTLDPGCAGDCDGSIIINPIGGTQPFTYTWNNGVTQTLANPSELCSGTYLATITDANGCSIEQPAILNEPVPISIALDSIVNATCVNSTDGGIYIEIIGGNGPLTYEWTNNTNTDTVTTQDLINVLPLQYFITVSDLNGCNAIDTFNIDTVLTVLAFTGNDTILCFESDLAITGLSNQTSADYTWYDINGVELSDSSYLTIPSQTPGSAQYILMAAFGGCSQMDTITVTTQDQVNVDAGPDFEIFSTETSTLGGTPTTTDVTSYLWSPSTFIDDTTVANPSIIKPQNDAWYTIFVVDSLGCFNSDSVYVEIIPTLVIPNGISPNGDGKNETWQLVFKEDFPDMEVSVYNRWGELLFYDNNGYTVPWDGKFQGEELPVGSYYYVIDVNHEQYPEPFTGPLTIMR